MIHDVIEKKIILKIDKKKSDYHFENVCDCDYE